MDINEYLREMKEILESKEFNNLSYYKKKDYRSWLADTAKHGEKQQHVIHTIKYRLGILRTQQEEE
jgi:hypothetical protein